MELHHIVQEAGGGESTLENCIPLCFNCHADVGHYNSAHPKGTKYSASELRGHRDKWFAVMQDLSAINEVKSQVDEIYEGQRLEFFGYVWREAFPGPPNYESLETDSKEVHWMLVLRSPITLIATSFEDDSSFKVSNVRRLQLLLNARQYEENRALVLSEARVVGKLWHSHTGHHHGDALLEVEQIWADSAETFSVGVG